MVPFKNFSEKVIQYLENVFLQFLMLSVVCVFHLHLTPQTGRLRTRVRHLLFSNVQLRR